MIKIFITVLEIIIPLLVCFLIIKNENIKEKTKKICINTVEGLKANMLKRNSGYFSYIKIDEDLRKKGAYYIFQEKISPALFIIAKFLIALLLFMATLSLSKILLISVIIGVLSFFLPDLLLNISNNNDNDAMLTDIKNMVDILKLQTNAGIHISQALITCYRTVENQRLKYELLEVINKILISNDILDAIDDFNERFDNEYIDMICIMIRQSHENGYSVQIMKDMSTQLSNLQKAINIKKQESLDRKIQALEVMIFIGLVSTCLYILVIEMFNAFTSI